MIKTKYIINDKEYDDKSNIQNLGVSNKTLTIKINRRVLDYDNKNVKKIEALNEFANGFADSAKLHKEIYKKDGIEKIKIECDKLSVTKRLVI